MNEKYIGYGIEDQERLDADPDNVMEYQLDGMSPSDWPETIEIFEHEPRIVSLDTKDVLDHVYEYLNEEYGDPYGNSEEPSEAVVAKTQELVDLIKSEYLSWVCDKNGNSKIINVHDWVTENAEEWLDNSEVQAWLEAHKTNEGTKNIK